MNTYINEKTLKEKNKEILAILKGLTVSEAKVVIKTVIEDFTEFAVIQ